MQHRDRGSSPAPDRRKSCYQHAQMSLKRSATVAGKSIHSAAAAMRHGHTEGIISEAKGHLAKDIEHVNTGRQLLEITRDELIIRTVCPPETLTHASRLHC